MDSRPTSSPARTVAAVCLIAAVLLSVALACVGCARNLPVDNAEPQNTEATSSAEFESTRNQFSVGEATFTPPPEPEPEPELEPEPTTYLASNRDILGLSSDKGPFAFALAEEDTAPALSNNTGNDIAYAASVFFESDWKVGYLLVDLETGRGVAGGLDERVFGASAIKAPFVHFMCERWLDTGKASLEDTIVVADKTMTLKEAIEAAILKSDNDSYKALFNAYSAGWGSWLDELGILGEINSYQRNPYYTARESGIMWLAIYRYINAEDGADEHAEWLASMLANTQVSFMRHAISNSETSVSSKPGWYATPEGSEYDMDGFCEAGIVSENGHDYLLTVMTNAAYKGALEDEFEDIIQAVWAARKDIAVQ